MKNCFVDTSASSCRQKQSDTQTRRAVPVLQENMTDIIASNAFLRSFSLFALSPSMLFTDRSHSEPFRFSLLGDFKAQATNTSKSLLKDLAKDAGAKMSEHGPACVSLMSLA